LNALAAEERPWQSSVLQFFSSSKFGKFSCQISLTQIAETQFVKVSA